MVFCCSIRAKTPSFCGPTVIRLYPHSKVFYPTECNLKNKKSNILAGWWWLMPVILATQEVELRRIAVWSQAEQIVCKILPWRNPKQQRAGGVAQVVGCLPSRYQALSSNPTTIKKKTTPQNPIYYFFITFLRCFYVDYSSSIQDIIRIYAF
jgi:hypothetical protein